ncbi:hypothetical protein [Natronoglycomyces albus]|uniref:Uncharacterized protein n=1 Tax=Natronoglycomyces albus TaxID=2811108 RepID=A0A895XKK0_9ACTN|nr:hypothetical protein [Natronoglycomyces albus]QSB03949.1 hypothetical protein JQS30_08935 [Natronoglycomyces albus]
MRDFKPTSDSVVEFVFKSDTYMVSPHAARGSALALNLQGQCMVIPVATILVSRGFITDTDWETPFSGRSREWQDALLAAAEANFDSALKGVG